MKKYRVGIDVGGTFTDAVVVDNETYQLVGQVKVPTTHDDIHGVSAGIVKALDKLMDEYQIAAEQITFIAHGTTQATNALLEGDVSKVGVVTMGKGIEGWKSKIDTNMGKIEIAEGKFLNTSNHYINSTKNIQTEMRNVCQKIKNEGLDSVVISEAFSVDNPENEESCAAIARKQGLQATASHDVSKLYGLKVRTRTAVVNASILPRMMETADMTESSIKRANIKSPLMIMRCDGGVMTIDEVRTRPILTILSGPAAGVAGALMYEKLTDGIFLEVGGTSTDISCVKDGNVVLKYSSIGGHKTYLNSLDVRTVGIGGGSMVRIDSHHKITDVGPRSAHIAALDYEVFANAEDIQNPVLKAISPLPGDPTYAYIECSNGKEYSLTLTGAANICGYIPEDDYAHGNLEAAIKAWEPLAKAMNLSVKATAEMVLDLSAKRNGEVVSQMIKDYGLLHEEITMVGGGGGASSVVPHLANKLGVNFKIAENASVISPIGVALALVRDMVERTVTDPTEQDIMSIRKEAIQMAINSGATEDSIEVKIEIDSQQNKLRAIATGATELRSKTLGGRKKTEQELKEIVADNLKQSVNQINICGKNDYFTVLSSTRQKKHLLFFRKEYTPVRVVDYEGVIRLQKVNSTVVTTPLSKWKSTVDHLIAENIVYGDGGEEIPNIYIIDDARIIDLSGMRDASQILSLCEAELKASSGKSDLIVICTLTTENQRG